VLCRVAPERDGRKPHAFVKLSSVDEAWTAVRELTQNPPIPGMVVKSAESDTGGSAGKRHPFSGMAPCETSFLSNDSGG
jgi:hypothetical protein